MREDNRAEEICGKCLHHRKEDEEWICKNPNSECWGCYTEYRDTCGDFEERQPKSKFSVEIVNHRKK